MSLAAEPLAMLAASRDNPEDDTPRVALADYLDENGEPSRATLIRTQVALSRMGHLTEPKSHMVPREFGGMQVEWTGSSHQEWQRHRELKEIEGTIIKAHPEWLTLRCPDPECVERGKNVKRGTFRKGKAVDPVQGTELSVGPIRCPLCHLSKDLFVRREWSPDYDEWLPSTRCVAQHHRGTIRLVADAADCWRSRTRPCQYCREGRHHVTREECSHCDNGEVRTTVATAWLAAVARCPWVTGVLPIGFTPNCYHSTTTKKTVWNWEGGLLPNEVHFGNGFAMGYDTAEEATNALGRGLLRFGSKPQEE